MPDRGLWGSFNLGRMVRPRLFQSRFWSTESFGMQARTRLIRCRWRWIQAWCMKACAPAVRWGCSRWAALCTATILTQRCHGLEPECGGPMELSRRSPPRKRRRRQPESIRMMHRPGLVGIQMRTSPRLLRLRMHRHRNLLSRVPTLETGLLD